jgi:hypothetical protein
LTRTEVEPSVATLQTTLLLIHVAWKLGTTISMTLVVNLAAGIKRVLGRLTDALTAAQVAHSVKKDGAVAYDPSLEERVNAIRREVLRAEFNPGIQFHNAQVQKEFISRLQAQKITYWIQSKNDGVWISWRVFDDAQVQTLHKMF